MSKVFLGVDIGTTSLSFTAVSMHARRVMRSVTLPNDSALPASQPGFHEQDPERIARIVIDAVRSLLAQYPDAVSIGVTGQMHGVLLLSAQGLAVSPLYTWQDARADETCLAEIAEKSGYTLHAGYGCATLYANAQRGLLVPGAHTFCTIMDYVVMRLTGRTAPLMHVSNAASLGLFSMNSGDFDRVICKSLLPGLDAPQVTMHSAVAGMFEGIPVAVAIGDNQASFFGSVRDEAHGMLANYGTGSQLSIVCAEPVPIAGGEIRPYLAGKYLLCFSALCGGRAYAILERFFSRYMTASCGDDHPQYETMNALAARALQQGAGGVKARTTFCGTRDNPALRGSITQLTDENFTPENLILAVLQGMADELAAHFSHERFPHITQLTASGNAVMRNPVLQRLLADTFSIPVILSAQTEEAALGAALHGGVCSSAITYEQAKSYLQPKG